MAGQPGLDGKFAMRNLFGRTLADCKIEDKEVPGTYSETYTNLQIALHI